MKKNLLIGCLCFLCLFVSAQSDPVIMRINGKQISRSEFEFFYRHSIVDKSSDLSPNQYAESFIQLKLQVGAAKEAGLDTTRLFKNRQEIYYRQLLSSYLVDSQTVDYSKDLLYAKDKEPMDSGRVKVVQIFKRLPQVITKRHLAEEKELMDSIYLAIKDRSDSDFIQLVRSVSDDKETRWIEKLQTTPEFEEVAFSLHKGETSQPFFTSEGLHILRVINQRQIVKTKFTNGSACPYIVQHGQSAGVNAMVERLKKEYHYTANISSIDELLQNGTTAKELFTINGVAYTGEMFKNYASSHPQNVKKQLNGFVNKSLLDYASQHIGNKKPEFAYLVQMHGESYLAELVMKLNVDYQAMTDKIGLATYFKLHSSDYRWDTPRYKGIILHSVDKKTSKRAKKLIKKMRKKKTYGELKDLLLANFNHSGKEMIKIEQGVFAYGENQFVDKLVFKKGDFIPLVSYPFTVTIGGKLKGPEDYMEVLDQVRIDYRSYLSAYWMQELRDKAKVEIKQEVLKTVNNN